MATPNQQFSVGTHIMASIFMFHPQCMKSDILSTSVNTNPVQVRKVLSKLVKAGLVRATRGRDGACGLGRDAAKITLLDIYRATEDRKVFHLHDHPVYEGCKVSCNIKDTMTDILSQSQEAFEQSLASHTLAEIAKTLAGQKPANKRKTKKR